MYHNPKKLFMALAFKQRGAALILMVFILGLAVAAYTIRTFNTASLQSQQDEKTFQTLAEAKAALIGWAVSHPNTPGQMLWPDRNGDGNYDGNSDCVTTAFQYSYLLGQLPVIGQTNPCVSPQTGLGGDWRDAQGNHLWYAVSRNLVRDYNTSADPAINPGIINTPTYQWLQVLDRNGNLISNRVAAVIIAPGAAIGGQSRSGAAPNTSEYLDSFQIGVATFNNRGYATDDEDFIMGDDSRNVSASDTTFVQPYNFNDKLVYITIDELMAALEKRVGEQARSSLKAYQDANGYYPYATQFGTTANYSAEPNLLSGFLPVDYQSCSYTRISSVVGDSTFLSCNHPIFDATTSGVAQVRFTRVGGSAFTASTSNCTFTSNNCNCTGAGTCSNALGLSVFCTTAGCSSISPNGAGALGMYIITGGKFTSPSGGCVQTTSPTKNLVTGCHNTSAGGTANNGNAVITCSAANGSFASSADVRFDNILPAWFKANNWQDYVYYDITRPTATTMTVGSRNAEAAVVTLGRPIDTAPFASKGSSQARPSCNALNNYLDSTENANGNTVYDATSTLPSASYNDQNFIVTP